VDIDRFIGTNQASWDRLAELTDRTRRRWSVRRGDPSTASSDDLAEFVQLYQRASAQLSYAQTYYRDPALNTRLTRVVAEAHHALYGTRARTPRALLTFFTSTFPAAVWHNRRFVALAAAVFFVPAAIMLIWLTNSTEALDALQPPSFRASYCATEFEEYYTEQPSAQFATVVGLNNIYVSFLAFFGGALLLPGLLVLALNGLVLGQAGAVMTSCGEARTFWTLIAPHGLLELTAIILAAAAGLSVGWNLIAPGDRTRADAFSEDGRRAGAMVLGLVAFFSLAALIEGFVTGSALPIEIRVAIGVVVWLAFVAYIVSQGRTAAGEGISGMLGQTDNPWADWAPPEPDATPAVAPPPGVEQPS
jgi:uncharacterized membrane protein SpoIIM required for sporulation